MFCLYWDMTRRRRADCSAGASFDAVLGDWDWAAAAAAARPDSPDDDDGLDMGAGDLINLSMPRST